MRRGFGAVVALIAGFGALNLTGCVPFSTKMDSWIGRPIQTWLDLLPQSNEVLEEVRGPDATGNKIYVIRIEKNCRVFNSVDPKGIITAWRSEGSACKHYTN